MVKWILATAFLFAGCNALQDKTGGYVEEAVIKKIEADIDAKLAAKGVTLKEVKATVDTNGDGKLSQKEIIDAVKEYSKDFLVVEGQKLMAQHGVTKDQLDQKGKESTYYNFLYLAGLVLAYLGKQIFSAKADGHRDAKLDIMQKLLLNNQNNSQGETK